ncbi:MAG TPA: hypothetical protein PK563_14480 [Tenuifilaceae bacterium]|nr:hypothetical protein [Tenuifilaceae bacterium]
MKTNEQIVLSTIPVESLAVSVSEIIWEKIKKELPKPQEKKSPEYLTRKQSYTRLGIAGPTFDKLVKETNTVQFGRGKGGRFRKEDVEYIYENLNQLLYKR